jgi:hypothetical protein
MEIEQLETTLYAALAHLRLVAFGYLSIAWIYDQDSHLHLQYQIFFTNGKMSVEKVPGGMHRLRPCNARNLAHLAVEIVQNAVRRHMIPSVLCALRPSMMPVTLVEQAPIMRFPRLTEEIRNGNQISVSKNTEFINEDLMGMPALGEPGHPTNNQKRLNYVYLQSEVSGGIM